MCVPWELNPQPLRCKCSSLPLIHRNTDLLHTITAVSLWHKDITRLLVSSFEILSSAFNAANSNCCLFWGVSAFTLLFSRWNSCSFRFKSGDWLGQSKTFHFFALDWTGRVFWVIVLMQYEALPNESGGIFLNIGRQDGFGPFQIYSLSSHIKSSVKLRGSVPETACMPMPWHHLHHALQMRLYAWDLLQFPFSPHFCFPII